MIDGGSQRILHRRATYDFNVGFFGDVLNTVPIIPLDASKYPSYAIYDPSNNQLQTGVGIAVASAGRYRAPFVVPDTAPLSTDLSRWRIEWSMVSDVLRQQDFVEEFDVKDVVFSATESREQKFVTIPEMDYRVSLRLGYAPFEVKLALFRPGQLMAELSVPASSVQRAEDGDSLVYYYDIPGTYLKVNEAVNVLWSVRARVADPQEFTYQNVASVHPNTLSLATDLRMLIDKFQKRFGTVQAYETSDLVEYLAKGHELVNASFPTTYFPFGSNPGSFNVFHILLSGWYALQAQQLLETDLSISFSGQRVTFDYDHASQIADVASRWQDFVDKNLPPAKLAIVRSSTPAAVVSGRALRWSDSNSIIYKTSSWRGNYTGGSGGAAGGFASLARLGLLW